MCAPSHKYLHGGILDLIYICDKVTCIVNYLNAD